MLIHDFAYADGTVALVGSKVVNGGRAWLTPLATAAVAEGERMRVRLGDGRGEPFLDVAIAVAVGEAYTRNTMTVVPMTWVTDGAEGAVPMLRGQLEITPFGATQAQISLLGTYEPPFGHPGRQLDRLLLQRIAEASIRIFLRQVCATVSGESTGLPAHPTP